MPNIADYAYYVLIYNYLNNQINQFGMDLMGRMITWASAIALTLVTLWIIIQGYRIVTGQSREPMMHMVAGMSKIALIVTAATTMAVMGTDLHNWLTVGLDQEINGLFTGNGNQTTATSIDQNLAYTQVALSTIDAVQVVPGDTEMQTSKARSELIATFGTASPPMAAGAMLLLYQFTIALFIGLGPLFILCLIFEQTKDLFRRWLLYGIGTLFSMATLSVVSSMVLGLTAKVSAAYWTATVINSIMGNSSEGLTNQAMQQGGIGLLMTVLIISVPPMAAMFFQGTVGSFMHFSAFAGGEASRPGPQGQPPGSYGAPPESCKAPTNVGNQAATHGRGFIPAANNEDVVKPRVSRPNPTQGGQS